MLGCISHRYSYRGVFVIVTIVMLLKLYCSVKGSSHKVAQLLSWNSHHTTNSDSENKDHVFTKRIHQDIETGKLSLPKLTRESVDIGIVAGIVVAKRNYAFGMSPQWYETYISITVSHILNQLSESNMPAAGLFICQVDQHQQTVTSVRKWKTFVKIIQRSTEIDAKNIFEKERLDYAFCMDAALQQWPNSTAIVLFEDDAAPLPSFMPILNKLHRQMQQIVRIVPEYDRPAYVKLYHPVRLRKIPWIIQALSISVLLTLTLWFMCATLAHGKIPQDNFCFIFMLSLLTTLILGQERICDIVKVVRSLVWLDEPYLVQSESCCLPAVYYPTQNVPKIIEFLNSEHCYEGHSKDHLMDELPNNIGPKLMTDTNYVRHIGRYSSLRQGPVEIYSI